MVMGWCTTAEAVVYERARPLKRPEEGGSRLKRAERPEEGGGGGDKVDRVGVGERNPGGVASLHALGYILAVRWVLGERR